MSNKIPCKITLELNSTAYTGQDVQDVLPHFMTDYTTFVGLTWVPSAFGTEAFFISITIGAAIGVAQGFLSELGTDLYKWTKEKLLLLLKKKSAPEGQLIISWQDITVTIYIEKTDDILDILSKFNIIEAKALKSLPKKEVDLFPNDIKELFEDNE